MLKLDRYILRNFMLGMIPVMVLLLSLFSFMELAETLKRVGEGGFVLKDAFRVVALTTPKRIVDLLPVAAMLGSLMGLGGMANHQELTAIRAAGFSKRRIARPVLMGALALVGLVLALQFFMVPASERHAAQLKSKSLQQTKVGTGNTLEFWTRSHDNFIRVRSVRFNRSLSDVEIYRIDASGRLVQMFLASHADSPQGNNWVLTDVLQRDLGESEVVEQRKSSMNWPGLLNSRQAATLILPIQALSPIELSRYISYLKHNKMNTHQYRTVLWQQLSIPLVLIAMAMLSVPFLLGSVRRVSTSQRMVTGGIIGIGFFLVQQIAGNLAGLYGTNPPLTMMTPAMALLGIATYKILKP